MINTTKIIPLIGIYKITSPSNKIYIGQSLNILRRFNNYKRIEDCKTQIKLYNSLKKYGTENHIFEIIEECPLENLNTRERYWQDFYKVLEGGLNCKLTKTEDKNGFLNKETCNKIGKSKIGNKNNLGRVFTDEHKSNITKGKLGSIYSSSKTGEDHGNYGKVRDLHFKNNLSSIKIGVKPSEEIKLKRAAAKIGKGVKSILQYNLEGNFIKEWNSMIEASKILNIKSSGISACCKGNIKFSKGFIWRYKI